ncbi:single-stranded-DNA-specific exonuclease [Gracilibacillus halotolerans]|uniref:Single-stranded-DNA-specific exonuclease RecJ n=1 Tax=Gracilibacillus halotolerans TaxID=74386 RepID=A0A841RD70_9BACI|nr:single-stranded-DNA-specific exonuclease RecJ [Gracilibacillus halotolerans]MBB6511910.1 single-stranded-DNA-specific exonuclease [Gracilibacillus halotolerans]
MLASQSKWIFTYNDNQNTEKQPWSLEVEPIVKQMLYQRGVTTDEEAELFLNPTLAALHHSNLLDSIDKAVERVKTAIEKGESILVYGDYDADGVTSTAVMVEALRQSGAMCDYYIPNRFTEGYGPNEEAFREAHRQGFQLIITVDNGIAAVKEVDIANELGLDVIITDHHELQETLPNAYAIIHPKCSPDYPFKELAGVGVAFKFATHLLGDVPKELLDLVSIGTVADLVPLKDENRILVHYGLKQLKSTKRPGLVALKNASKLQDDVTEEDIGFRIAPRLNAVGRLQDANVAVDLLLTDNPEEAEELAGYVQELNTERQQIVTQITKEAKEMIETDSKHKDSSVIIIAKEGWNQGVLGIVASRLVETFRKPAIVLSILPDSNQAKGSARSIEAFDLFENCMKVKDLFDQFGGHAMAAGMTISLENIDRLREELSALADELVSEEDAKPVISIDQTVEVKDITLDMLKQLEKFAPYGMGNPKPIFHLVAIPSDMRQIGASKNHLKFKLNDQDAEIDGIGFGFGHLTDSIAPFTEVEVVGELTINEWNGIKKPQLSLKDVSVSDWQLFDYRRMKNWYTKISNEEDSYFVAFREDTNIEQIPVISSPSQLYELDAPVKNLYLLDYPKRLLELQNFLKKVTFQKLTVCFQATDDAFFHSIPTKEEFKWLYQLIRKRNYFDYKIDAPKLAKYKGWRLDKIKFMFQVFYELGFVTKQDHVIVPTPNPSKKDLETSTLYQEKLKAMDVEELLLYSSYVDLKKWLNEQIESELPKEEMAYGL